MCEILVVTNRSLCREDFLSRIEKIAAARPKGIILREKDLSGGEYKDLAAQVAGICEKHGTACILHSFSGIAVELGCDSLHLPLPLLRALPAGERKRFRQLGASCHSVEDAKEAETLGCTYITAGHVFDTACKAGLPGRGLEFLKEVCKSVAVPVYAIGGICPENMREVRRHGGAGACVMSGAMTCPDVRAYLSEFEEEHNEV